LYEGSPKRDDRERSVDGYPSEQREVFTAMRKSSKMGGGRVGQEDDGEGRDLSGEIFVSFVLRFLE